MIVSVIIGGDTKNKHGHATDPTYIFQGHMQVPIKNALN